MSFSGHEQVFIVQNQLVLGLEAIEGTDQLIQRCSEYKRKGDNQANNDISRCFKFCS